MARACSSTLIMRMHAHLGGVAIMCDYPHPALMSSVKSMIVTNCQNGSPTET